MYQVQLGPFLMNRSHCYLVFVASKHQFGHLAISDGPIKLSVQFIFWYCPQYAHLLSWHSVFTCSFNFFRMTNKSLIFPNRSLLLQTIKSFITNKCFRACGVLFSDMGLYLFTLSLCLKKTFLTTFKMSNSGLPASIAGIKIGFSISIWTEIPSSSLLTNF